MQFQTVNLCKIKVWCCSYAEQCREHKKYPIPVKTINCMNAAGSTYSPVTNTQPQNKKEISTILPSQLNFKSSRSLQDLPSKSDIKK